MVARIRLLGLWLGDGSGDLDLGGSVVAGRGLLLSAMAACGLLLFAAGHHDDWGDQIRHRDNWGGWIRCREDGSSTAVDSAATATTTTMITTTTTAGLLQPPPLYHLATTVWASASGGHGGLCLWVAAGGGFFLLQITFSWWSATDLQFSFARKSFSLAVGVT
uniref:Uncharacterized protein n=1 Tax=Oryza punctata TaxID=4537 RepID=A0A0E0JLW6_ORYPU